MTPGDAPIAAIAITCSAHLITANNKDFYWIKGLKLINPLIQNL